MTIKNCLMLAKAIANFSPCLDKQVGAVVTDTFGRIVGLGCNEFLGPLSACKRFVSDTCKGCNISHAEAVALAMAEGKSPMVLYCTLEPCANCQKLIEEAGIQQVFFLQKTSERNRQCAPFKGIWKQIDLQEHSPLTLVEMGELIKNYHETLTWPVLSKEKQVENARNIGLALIVEAQEVLQAVPWKPWKPEGYKDLDLDNLVEELADLLFFMGSMLEIFGLSWSQLEEAFLKKLEENKRRKKYGETI